MREHVLTPTQRFIKRTMDLALAVPGLILTMPLVVVAVAVATVDTREWGIFSQERIGRYGRPFTVYKIRTMRSNSSLTSTATMIGDPRVTGSGRIFRRFKIDELPQLYNVVRGDMSLVGPRPDVAGFADRLEGDDRVILTIRPGITGPATLAFRHEEELLAEQPDPEAYNLIHVWPEKVRINRAYVRDYSLIGDIRTLLQTAAASLLGSAMEGSEGASATCEVAES